MHKKNTSKDCDNRDINNNNNNNNKDNENDNKNDIDNDNGDGNDSDYDDKPFNSKTLTFFPKTMAPMRQDEDDSSMKCYLSLQMSREFT